MSTIVRVDKGANHWYELDGERVDGVTTIQRKAIPKQDTLVPWAGRKAGECVLDDWDALVAMKPSERYKHVSTASRRSNEAAKVRGRKVHSYGERVAAGEEVIVPPELAGYVEAYTQFLYDYDVTVTLSEAVVWSKTHGHVGTLDMGAMLTYGNRQGYEEWLIDVKTGNGVYDDVAFQLAGYRYADTLVVDGEEHPMPTFDRCGVLHVWDGDYALHEVEVTEETYRGFLYLKESAAAIEANEGAVGEPLEPPIRMEF